LRLLAVLNGVAAATLLGASVGKRIVGRITDRVFVLLVEVGPLAAATLFPAWRWT
jgi:uncharacterized protein